MGGCPRGLWLGVVSVSLASLVGCDVSFNIPTSRSASLTPASSQVAASGAASASRGVEPLDALQPDTLGLIPTESMIAVFVRPVPKEINPDHDFKAPPLDGEAESAGLFQVILTNVLPQLVGGQMKPGNVIGMRATEAFFHATRFPYAFVIVDAALKPMPGRPEGVRIDGLKCAAIIRTAGQSAKFASILQQTIDRVTSEATAKLTSGDAHGVRYQRLADSRLDADEVVTWGEIGPHFVLTFGEGVFQQIAACAAGEQSSMRQDRWIQTQREKRAADTYVDLVFDAQRIRARLDPQASGAASEFFVAWDAEKLERSYWTFGAEGKAMFCVANHLVDGENYERVYARAYPPDSAIMTTVPPGTSYSVYELPVGRFLYRFFAGLTATRDARIKAEIQTNWRRLQEAGQFDGQRDILAHLGERIVIHKYPLHPLRIPVCATTLIEIRENPREVARAIDAMFNGWNNIASENIEKGIVMPATLTKDSDGIWFLNFGLAGPAWVVTDKYLVGSWSPTALRDYLSVAGEAAGRPIKRE